jgi:hypothetical protein
METDAHRVGGATAGQGERSWRGGTSQWQGCSRQLPRHRGWPCSSDLKLEKNPNERCFPTREADNGDGGPKSGEGPRPRCAEPTKQARWWKGQLTMVLLQGEAVAHVEKGGGALGGFSSQSGKEGRRNGGGSRVDVRVGAGEETRRGAGAVVDSTGGRQWPGHGTHGRHGTVRTGERRGPLTFGPWPAAGERGRGEQRGMWAGPGEREMGRARRNRKIFDLFK